MRVWREWRLPRDEGRGLQSASCQLTALQPQTGGRSVLQCCVWKIDGLCEAWQFIVAPGFSPECAALKGGCTVNAFSKRNTRTPRNYPIELSF